MFSVIREVVNGMNGIELNITESGVVRSFDCREDAQAYLRKLQAKADCIGRLITHTGNGMNKE